MPLTELKNQAIKALLDGDYACARDLFTDIHQRDPSDIRVFAKLAEIKEKTGDSNGAITDYIEIASSYAENGFIVQAIAINKIILRLDPENEEINQKLQLLSSERGQQWATCPDLAKSDDNSASESSFSHSEQLKSGARSTPLLSGLSGQELNAFIDSLELKEFSAGELIYREGDRGEFLYLIGSGSVSLQTRLRSGATRIYSRLHEGDFFGEHAFMSHLKHSNSAVAEADTSILMIKRVTFEQWVSEYPQILDIVEEFYRQRVLSWVLAVTPLFEGIADKVRMVLADRFKMRRFKQGETIMVEGESGDTFYLIRSGSVQVTTSKKGVDDQLIELGHLQEGSFFGEVSLLTDRPRTATVVAEQDVELMELTRKDFNSIASRFPSVRRVVESYQRRRVKKTIEALVQRN